MEVDDRLLPPLAALNSMTIIGLADDGDVGLTVTSSLVNVTSGSDGDESGNDELFGKKKFMLIKLLKHNKLNG